MSLFQHHIFICTNERPEDDKRGCCKRKGSESLLEAFRTTVHERGLKGKVRVNKAGCLDQCELGPSLVIYPEGVWYSKVQSQDVKEILDAMLTHQRVERLLHPKQK